MKIKKALVVASTSLLCFPLLFFPVISTRIPVSAIENSAELPKAPELLDPLGSTTETKLPIFSFEESQEPHMAGRQFELVVHASQEASEFVVDLPEGVSIVEDKRSTDIKFTNIEGNQWQVQASSPQMTFSLPLIVEKEGEYEVAIGESKTTLNIQAEESRQTSEQEIISSEEKETANTEESKVEEEMSVSNDEPSSTTETTENHSEQVMENARSTKETGVQDVANWQEFIRAFSDPTISTIEISNDFEVPITPLDNQTSLLTGNNSNVSGAATFVYLIKSSISRTLTINGNGHQIDFGSVSLGMYPATHNSNSPWNITFNDLDVYSGNWWGFFQTTNLTIAQHSVSNITLNNINSYGNELIAPYYTNVNISGVVNNHITETYTSKFRTNWRVNTVNSVNLETRSLRIKENAELNLSSVNSGNLIIGLGGVNANLTLEKNARINLESNGTSAGDNANGFGSSIDIVNGNLTMNEGSKINVVTTRNFSALNLRSTNSVVKIDNVSKININSTSHTWESNAAHRNLVYMAGGSSLSIGEESEFNIEAKGRGAAASNIIHIAGNAKFSVGKNGTLNVKSDSTSISQSLLSFTSAGSTFQFSDAKRVNLERTGAIAGTSTSNGLINIAGRTGLLDINVQSVKQWERGNFNATANLSWIPIFNLNIRYTGIVPRIDTVSSISQETTDSFKQLFTTQNVQRILFEKIPDVEVTMDPLTEGPNEINSYTITGKANPNSVIRFSGDSAIPSATIDSPDTSESEKYHTMADENGYYRYELPKDRRFTAGNTVTAYAFLNGKNDTASTIVEEKVVMSPVDPLNPKTDVKPENKPEISENQGRLSLDFISQFNFGIQRISNSDQTYYAQPQRLLNEAETVNESEERPNYVQISDRRPDNERNGWQLSVTQNEQFSNQSGHELIGSEIQLFNQELVSAQGGTIPELQEEPVQQILPNTRKVLIQANGESGTGTWIYRLGNQQTADKSVGLYVPKGTNPEATSYSTKLTWELSAVPDN